MDYKQGEITPMNNDLQVRNHIVELLAKRRDYQQEIKDIVCKYEYVVFYGCGTMLPSIVDTWNQYIGRKIDYTCDSNSEKWGQLFCGIKCISPQELLSIKERCAVFVSIGDYKPVFHFLTERGFPSVNFFHMYDIIAHSFLSKVTQDELVDNLCKIYGFLADQRSVKVFDSIINRVFNREADAEIMSCVCEKNQYFPPLI